MGQDMGGNALNLTGLIPGIAPQPGASPWIDIVSKLGMVGTMQPQHWGALQGMEGRQLYGRQAATTEKRAVAREERDVARETRDVAAAGQIEKARRLDIKGKKVTLEAQKIELEQMQREAEVRGNQVKKLPNYTSMIDGIDPWSGQPTKIPGQAYEVYQELDEFDNIALDESGRPITKYYPIEVGGDAAPTPEPSTDPGIEGFATALIEETRKRAGETGINLGKLAPDLADFVLDAAEEMKARIPKYWEKLTPAQKQQAATARATAKMRGQPTSTEETIEAARQQWPAKVRQSEFLGPGYWPGLAQTWE